MFQVHRTDWLNAGVFVCVAFAAALAILAHFRKLKLPHYVFFVLIGLAFLQMLLMDRQKLDDNLQMRRELKEINPLVVSNLVVRADGGHRDIVSTNEVNVLFSQLKHVQAVPAKHRHPTDSFEVGFMIGDHVYRYGIGRDSARTDEYWVFETARAGNPGREIGRIQSPALGQEMNLLTHGASLPQR